MTEMQSWINLHTLWTIVNTFSSFQADRNTELLCFLAEGKFMAYFHVYCNLTSVGPVGFLQFRNVMFRHFARSALKPYNGGRKQIKRNHLSSYW